MEGFEVSAAALPPKNRNGVAILETGFFAKMHTNLGRVHTKMHTNRIDDFLIALVRILHRADLQLRLQARHNGSLPLPILCFGLIIAKKVFICEGDGFGGSEVLTAVSLFDIFLLGDDSSSFSDVKLGVSASSTWTSPFLLYTYSIDGESTICYSAIESILDA